MRYRTIIEGELDNSSDVLVVLHLYYPDMWDYFESNLGKIGSYDLLVTTSLVNHKKLPANITSRANTKVVYTTNRGRDILPFLTAVNSVDIHKYKAILKLHTKKSPHYEDGADWLDSMVEQLTSIDTNSVIDIFNKQPTIVGPAGQYMSLEVNFEANGTQLEKLLKGQFSYGRIKHYTQTNRGDYGFFAGSMVWLAPKYLNNKLFKQPIYRFDLERGQVDGTYAHAFERAMTLQREISDVPIFETDGERIAQIKYDAGLIPEWSDKFRA